jgi:predicted RNA binding protein YcfA (HicA-like mRNA interferase family)
MQLFALEMSIPTQVSANDLVTALERVGFQLVNCHRARLWLERGQQLISVPCTGPLSDGAVRSILESAGLTEAQLEDALSAAA